MGPDGRIRDAAVEDRLNKSFTACFTSPAGREVLDHLRAITLMSVAGPAVQPNELLHREGQRFVVALIQQRIDRGNNAA